MLHKETVQNALPSTGFIRLSHIIGNKKTHPPITPLIPVSRSSWWAGVKSGIYPQPIKIGARATAWKVEDIQQLISQLGGN